MGDLARLLGGIMAAPPLDPAAIRYYRRELKGFLPVDELMTIVLSRKITRRVRCLLAQAGSRRTWTRGGNVGDIARSLGSIMTSRPVASQTYSMAPRRRRYTPREELMTITRRSRPYSNNAAHLGRTLEQCTEETSLGQFPSAQQSTPSRHYHV